ncbi:MAG TPA: hypothetical protein VFW89_05420 [Gemmatimonadaceae bacterium]|nr:hypothetical protein [Gemmatimonadaceae bacterium]
MPFGSDDQRLALMIETQANLEGIKAAQLATANYANAVKNVATTTAMSGATTTAATVSTQKLIQATEDAGRASGTLGGKAQLATRAFAELAQMALNGQASVTGVARAGASASEAVSGLAPAMAKIGPYGLAAAVILTALYKLYQNMHEEAKKIKEDDYQRALNNARTVASQQRILESLKKQRAELIAQGGIVIFIEKVLDHFNSSFGKLGDLRKKMFDLQEHEKDTAAEEARQARDRAIQLKESYDVQVQAFALDQAQAEIKATGQDSLARSTYLQRLQTQAQLADQIRSINQTYTQRDADGQVIALTGKQLTQRDKLVAAAKAANAAALAELATTEALTRAEANRAASHRIAQGSETGDPYQDQVKEIREAEAAAIRSGEDRVLAEQETTQKIRALQKGRFDEAITMYQKMSDAAILHGTVVGAVASVAAKAIALYEMIPQAKKDIQKGKSEFAAALADFAVPGKQPLGAAHLLASGAYFSAAAFGFAEAAGLGGGGGGGSAAGGGGSSAASTSGTFEPADRSQSGGQTIILQTVDPYSGAAIGQTIYAINRSGQLKKPVQLPPTRGLTQAGA